MLITTPSFKVLQRPIDSTQYVSIRYTERLAEAGIEPSVGRVGDSYVNALAEAITGFTKPGLFTAEDHGKVSTPWSSRT